MLLRRRPRRTRSRRLKQVEDAVREIFSRAKRRADAFDFAGTCYASPFWRAAGQPARACVRSTGAAPLLGDPEHWPQSLKTIVRVMLDSRYAMWMLWGPEYTFFCNDAYLPTVGLKRDRVMGARSDKVWEEVWSTAIVRPPHTGAGARPGDLG